MITQVDCQTRKASGYNFLIITSFLPFSLDSGKHAFLYSFLLLGSLLNDRLRPFHLEYKVKSH
jgi:hypothetical protein